MIHVPNILTHEIRTRAVIFDMDGVITDTMPDHFSAWQMVLRDRGIEVSHLDIYKREGQRGLTSVQEIFADYGRPYEHQEALLILQEKEEIFKRTTRNKFITGTRSLLKDLKIQDFRLAIVTGTSRHELERILPGDIQRLFDVIVTGDNVKNGKPDPEPYLLALQKLNLPAKDCVVVENAPFGIASAKGAGLRCIAIATSLPQQYLSGADHVFSSIAQMRKNLKFIRS